MQIFPTKQLVATFELSSLNMKNILGWVVESKEAPSLMIVEVREKSVGARKKGNTVSVFAITALLSARSGYETVSSDSSGIDCGRHLCPK